MKYSRIMLFVMALAIVTLTTSQSALAIPAQQPTVTPAPQQTPPTVTPAPDAPPTGSRPAIRGAGSRTSIADSYIVVLKDSASLRRTGMPAQAHTLAAKYNGRLGFVYEHTILGFSTTMSEIDARRLAADPAVDYVEQDQRVRLADTDEMPTWGLDRIDQRALPLSQTYSYDAPAATQNANVTVYVVDSGIRITHQEFGGRARYGWDAITGTTLAVDCTVKGHGTMVAGIIGGKTYGVAKNVNLVAVRAFDCTNSGSMAQIVAATDWVTANAVKPAVVNMSVEFYCNPAPCDLASGNRAINDSITQSIESGVQWVVAAGNQNADACGQPIATAPNAITVAASDAADARYPSSNWGPCVNIFAPGVNITSAHNATDSATGTSSGTSYATPHVTGVVALILGWNPYWASQHPKIIRDQLYYWATQGAVSNTKGARNWLVFYPPPPIAGSPIAVARNQDGRLTLVGINYSTYSSGGRSGGTVLYRTQTASGWTGWTQTNSSPTDDEYSIAAKTDVGGRINLVTLGMNDWISRRNQVAPNSDIWSAQSTWDGFLTSVAVARNGDGRLEMFGVNKYGQAFNRWEITPGSNTWSSWSAFQGCHLRWGSCLAITVRSVAAETNGNGQIEVFVLANDGTIWHRWQTGGGAWSSWQAMDGLLTSIAAARTPAGTIFLVGANKARQVFHRWQAFAGTNNWYSWSQFPGGLQLQSVAVEANADGRLEVFGVNSKGQIWHSWETAPGASLWSSWAQIDGYFRP